MEKQQKPNPSEFHRNNQFVMIDPPLVKHSENHEHVLHFKGDDKTNKCEEEQKKCDKRGLAQP
jgi:hypothetical protein